MCACGCEVLLPLHCRAGLLTEKHELVNALQEAVPEALLLQEAAPSRPLAAPSRALAAPMGGGAGLPANMSLVPVQAC